MTYHDLRTPHFDGRPAPGRRAHGCLPVDRWLSDGSGERSAKGAKGGLGRPGKPLSEVSGQF